MESLEFEPIPSDAESLDLPEPTSQEFTDVDDAPTIENTEFEEKSDLADAVEQEHSGDDTSFEELSDHEKAEELENNCHLSSIEGLADPEPVKAGEDIAVSVEELLDATEQPDKDDILDKDCNELSDPPKEASFESLKESVDDIGASEKAEIIKDFVDQNVTPSVLPKRNGHWEGEEGNSKWIPDGDASVTWRKSGITHTKTYRDIIDRYGSDGIEYINKEPDFEPYEDSFIQHAELEHFSDERTGSDGTYTMASKAVAERLSQETGEKWTTQRVQEYMITHGLTWHECADRKTVRAVPAEINAAFKHSGGISVEKSLSAAAESLDERFGLGAGYSLSRETPSRELTIEDKDEMNAAIQACKDEFRNKKRSR